MNDQYPDLYSSYQWLVPSQFNIASVCVHRWAENPHEGRRVALYYENERGQRQVWTYARLSQTSKQLANGLVKMGIAPGDRVALAMGQRAEAITAYMAIFSVGAIAVPLDAQLNHNDLGKRLRDADARLAIVDAERGPGLVQVLAQCPNLSRIIGLEFTHDSVIAWRGLLARQPATFKPLSTPASSPALLLYDQGGDTRPTPLGVLLPQRALIGNLPGFVASQNWFPCKGDVFWSSASWATHSGLMNALLPILYFGKPLVVFAGPLTGVRALQIMERYQVTNAYVSADTLALAIGRIGPPGAPYRLALRALAIAAGSADTALLDQCENKLHVRPNEIFGLTEMNALIGHSHKKWPTRPGSMGRPYPGHQLAVIDSQGRRCAPNVVGELALNRYDIHGYPDPALFLSYWRNEATAQARYVGPWCLTGVLASVDQDGHYWYAGASGKTDRKAVHAATPTP